MELLPPGNGSNADARHDLFAALDRDILTSEWFGGKVNTGDQGQPYQVMPYLLRAAALHERLPLFFLGRALYHLAQRRGFRSNRKSAPTKPGKDKDDIGKVEAGIGELRSAMGTHTLGEYFAGLNPHERRIRTRYTHRSMYEDEFEKIWAAQTPFNPSLLTEERRKLLRRAIFFQRPLRSARNLIGKCELEPGQRRAARHLLLSQRFRLVQKVNDLTILAREGERQLTSEERASLLSRLEGEENASFADIRKLLGLSKTKFNLEAGGEERISGNRTNARFRQAFGERWENLSPAERNRAVEYVWSFANTEKLAAAAAKRWGLDSGISPESE